MKQKIHGFTLIEVLIALVILAIALIAVVKLTGQSVQETTQIKDKMAAHWVAMNIYSEIQSGFIHLDQTNDLEGDEKMLNTEWHWHINVVNNPGGLAATITIKVMPLNSSKVVETLVGVIG